MRVIGIDPGTALCGYGIIDREGSRLRPVTYGVIVTTPDMPMAARLEKIYRELEALLTEYRPDMMGVEELFFNRNITTAMTVSQARGVVLLSAQMAGIALAEYTPLQVKQGVVGYGKATKHQVTEMTKRLLGIRETIRPDDAADALAIAICTILRERQTERLKQL